MKLLLDTNIIIHIIKGSNNGLINQITSSSNQKIFVSTASIAELKSIGLQNGWGTKKWKAADILLDEIVIVEINENLTDTYSEIDSYSQRRNPAYKEYPFPTPRNMGKNDLWIAATAALLGLKLVTTDNDFTHLDNVFLELELINPNKLLL